MKTMAIKRHMQAVAWLCALCAVLLCAPVHAGTKHYYYTDAQGTVLAKADAQGNIVAIYDYAPYGSQVLGTPPSGPSGYTGHVNDAESGLVYMQARYYDPVVGRFVSTDPIGSVAGSTFHFNRYAYVKNNPIINIDPFGMCADYYENGGCKIPIDDTIKDDPQAKAAQGKAEQVLNDNDKQVNGLKDNSSYHYIASKHFSGFRGTLTGREIKAIWNKQHFKIVPNGTDYRNGSGAGGGGATMNGHTYLTSDAVLGWEAGSPGDGVSSLIFHELGHETQAGKEARFGNEYEISGPRFQERERKVQSIGGAMAHSVGAPFSCDASSEGCE